MKFLAVLGLCLLATACGSDSGSKDNIPKPLEDKAREDILIISFTITGPDDSTNPASIDPAINNGTFAIDFNLLGADKIYDVELFVSTNNTLSEFDISFGQGQCAPTDNECNDGSSTDECRFTNNNSITCDANDSEGISIASALDTLPKDAYIILQACNITGSECDTASTPVTFR